MSGIRKIQLSGVQTQYTAVLNVIHQYLPGIACGSVDTESALAEFRQALKDADIVLFLKDSSEDVTDEDIHIYKEIKNK